MRENRTIPSRQSQREMDVSVASPQATAQFLLADRFRCRRDDLAEFRISGNGGPVGYFRFGAETICHGWCGSGVGSATVTDVLHDALPDVHLDNSVVELPFDPMQIANSLRFERYLADAGDGSRALPASGLVRRVYYGLRPALPVPIRKHVQGLYFRFRPQASFPAWPVDHTVESLLERLLVLSMKARGIERMPFIWFWPNGASSCAIVTHDVETSRGLLLCSRLMDLEDSFGIKSSFQLVPEERYSIPEGTLHEIVRRGFEVNIHDLNHDGRLFFDREEFLVRARRINAYAKQFGASGFRSAVMYRNLDWIDALDVSYDMSVPTVASLDPQKGGCCTVFPYFIADKLELPLTTTQDYPLFHVLKDLSIQLWRRQIYLILEKNGLISFIIHPDYVNGKSTWRVYVDLLEHLCDLRTQGKAWIALPKELAAWWRARSRMNLVKVGNSLRIEGEGSERACVAFAVRDGDSLHYSVNSEHDLLEGI